MGGRLGLVALAIVVVVAAFLIARPEDDDDGGTAGTPAADTTERSPTATAPSAPEPPPDGPELVRARIELKGHEAVGGVKTVRVSSDQRVQLTLLSDEADDIHVHGYDIEQPVGPGTPTKLTFRAKIEGIFEIESHEAEHVGKDALIARLVVEPS